MDTSETYIKMCEKAEEIQKECSYHDDDIVVSISNQITCGLRMRQPLRQEIAIWLPRQDQLQEMIGNFSDILDIIARISMEQLWLAFVMKEKYGKTWNGNEWVKA